MKIQYSPSLSLLSAATSTFKAPMSPTQEVQQLDGRKALWAWINFITEFVNVVKQYQCHALTPAKPGSDRKNPLKICGKVMACDPTGSATLFSGDLKCKHVFKPLIDLAQVSIDIERNFLSVRLIISLSPPTFYSLSLDPNTQPSERQRHLFLTCSKLKASHLSCWCTQILYLFWDGKPPNHSPDVQKEFSHQSHPSQSLDHQA